MGKDKGKKVKRNQKIEAVVIPLQLGHAHTPDRTRDLLIAGSRGTTSETLYH